MLSASVLVARNLQTYYPIAPEAGNTLGALRAGGL